MTVEVTFCKRRGRKHHPVRYACQSPGYHEGQDRRHTVCSAGVRVFLELGGWRAERISGRLLRRCLDPVAAERSWELGRIQYGRMVFATLSRMKK